VRGSFSERQLQREAVFTESQILVGPVLSFGCDDALQGKQCVKWPVRTQESCSSDEDSTTHSPARS
jgi:hypothetical protein